MSCSVGDAWTPNLYRGAVDKALLNKGAKRTLIAMLESGAGQYTSIDRASLCERLGVRREATISEHWRRGREVGLLESKARFNRSSLHRLTIPGVSADDDGLLLGRPLLAHIWTPEELEWWHHRDADNPVPPPWREGMPPF